MTEGFSFFAIMAIVVVDIASSGIALATNDVRTFSSSFTRELFFCRLLREEPAKNVREALPTVEPACSLEARPLSGSSMGFFFSLRLCDTSYEHAAVFYPHDFSWDHNSARAENIFQYADNARAIWERECAQAKIRGWSSGFLDSRVSSPPVT